jgi:putative transposase
MPIATQVRLYPHEQAAHLNRQFGAVWIVYNQGLRIMAHRYWRHGQSLSAKHDIKKFLPVADRSRRQTWFKQADTMALQEACLNLDWVFQAFFDPKRPARIDVSRASTPGSPATTASA